MKKNPVFIAFLIFHTGIFFLKTQTHSTRCQDGTPCLWYTVQKQESIYGIARKNGISQEDLLRCNPDLAKSGLKAGQTICIPVASTSSSATSSPLSLPETYTVKKGDTFFSIQKQFKLTRSELLELNPGLDPENLQEGMVLRLKKTPDPPLKEIIDAYRKNRQNLEGSPAGNINLSSSPPFPIKTHYTLGIVMPALSAEAELQTPSDWEKNIPFPEDISNSLEFWFGLQYAAENLSSDTLSLTFRIIHESFSDSVFLPYWNSFVRQNPSVDGFIGPFYSHHIQPLTDYTKARQIPLISPWINHNKFLFENPLAIKIITSQQTMAENLARFVYDSLYSRQYKIACFLASAKDSREQSYVQLFCKTFQAHSHSKDSVPVLKTLNDLKNFIQKHEKAVVMAFSQNKVLMTDFTTQLYLASQKKEVILGGLKHLTEFDNLDPEYLNILKYIFPSFTPLENPANDSVFVEKFKKMFYTVPSEYAYRGKSTGEFLFKSLKKEGWNFLRKEQLEWKDSFLPMKFFRPDFQTGLDNTACYIYQIQNYQFRRTGWK